MAIRDGVLSVGHLVAIVIQGLSLYTLYLAVSTLPVRDYGALVLSPILWSLIATIAFNYALNLWSLSISMYKISLCIGLVILAVASYTHSNTPLFITLLTGGSLPLLSSIVAILTRREVVSRSLIILIGKLIAAFLAVALVTFTLTALFTIHKPRIPVFTGKEAILPTGEVIEVNKVLRAYIEKEGRKFIVTDYGAIPVKNIAYQGEEVEITTYRGIINILREFFEALKKTGEQLVKTGVDVNISTSNLEVSTLELAIAKIYPYVKPLITVFPRILLHVLKLIYGLLLLVIVVVKE